MLLAVALTACTFIACDDNNDDDNKPKPGPLAGSYELATVDKDNGGVTINKVSLTIIPTWTTDVDQLPTVDVSAIMGYPAGTVMVGLKDMVDMIEPLIANFVQKGLVELDLNKDGTLGARYHEFQSQGNIALDFMQPRFADAISTFPGENDPLPADALQYYTEGGKLYFAVSKAFLGTLDETIVGIIEVLLEESKTLPIVSTEKLFALPLQYTEENGILKVYLDRATLAPFAPLLGMLGSLGLDLGGIDVEDIVTKLIGNTSQLEIAIYLKHTTL